VKSISYLEKFAVRFLAYFHCGVYFNPAMSNPRAACGAG